MIKKEKKKETSICHNSRFIKLFFQESFLSRFFAVSSCICHKKKTMMKLIGNCQKLKPVASRNEPA